MDIKMLEDKVFTEEFLGEVIYSYNKRAKNYRDMKRELKEKDKKISAEDKEIEYYKRKSFMINLLCEPKEIHTINGERFIWVVLGKRDFHIFPNEYCEDIKELKHLPHRILHNFETKGASEEVLISEEIADITYEIIKSLDFKVI
ncbi:hypothetical protein ACQ9ZF_11095 (plasmid) [Cetobacterium somerae]|uniref:hypothetical protein n=1 Tax=Cetobacterium somerae TaxID=188913 RepID=UPI003D769C3C